MQYNQILQNWELNLLNTFILFPISKGMAPPINRPDQCCGVHAAAL
jgi:hypothetical protein